MIICCLQFGSKSEPTKVFFIFSSLEDVVLKISFYDHSMPVTDHHAECVSLRQYEVK